MLKEVSLYEIPSDISFLKIDLILLFPSLFTIKRIHIFSILKIYYYYKMVSLQAAIPIYDLTFTTPVMDKSKVPYNKGTIMHYINDQKQYSIMKYLLQLFRSQ